MAPRPRICIWFPFDSREGSGFANDFSSKSQCRHKNVLQYSIIKQKGDLDFNTKKRGKNVMLDFSENFKAWISKL